MNLYYAAVNRGNLFFRLAYLARRWRKVLDTEFQSSGLTDATWRPLLHLHVLGENVRQKDLAASLGIEGPSLVRLIDTLVAKGFIERTEDSRDRRAKILRITPDGLQLVVRIRHTVAGLEERLFSTINDEEILLLTGLIQRLESSVTDLCNRVK